jgi:hypothetical protein
VLPEVDALLAGQVFESHYLTISDELTLSVWLVDPALDSAATADRVSDNNRIAYEQGLSVSYQIIDQVPCVAEVFRNINPMIVDDRYQTWYLDIIPIRVFATLDNPTADELSAAVESRGDSIAFHRRKPPLLVATVAPSGSCTWPEARAAIGRQFTAEERNTAAYLMIGNPPTTQTPWSDYATNNVVVEAQWDIQDTAEADDVAVLARLDGIAEALACLSSPVDLLEVFVVDPAGHLVVYAQVPGALIKGRVTPLPPASVLLRHTQPATP